MLFYSSPFSQRQPHLGHGGTTPLLTSPVHITGETISQLFSLVPPYMSSLYDSPGSLGPFDERRRDPRFAHQPVVRTHRITRGSSFTPHVGFHLLGFPSWQTNASEVENASRRAEAGSKPRPRSATFDFPADVVELFIGFLDAPGDVLISRLISHRWLAAICEGTGYINRHCWGALTAASDRNWKRFEATRRPLACCIVSPSRRRRMSGSRGSLTHASRRRTSTG
jgi:hypothetical protein